VVLAQKRVHFREAAARTFAYMEPLFHFENVASVFLRISLLLRQRMQQKKKRRQSPSSDGAR